MPVICPGCSTRYALPSHLLGSSGARICCPACWLTFVLGPDGNLTAVLETMDPAPSGNRSNGSTAAGLQGIPPGTGDSAALHPRAAGQPGTGEAAPRSAALRALRLLDDPPGRLARAEAEGRLFAEHGPELLAAFEALALDFPGEDMAAAFRAALFDIAGLDLAVGLGVPQ